MNGAMPYIVAACYLAGCVIGLLLRAASWFQKQPAGATFQDWWLARFGATLAAICLGILGVTLCVDGDLQRWTRLEGSAAEWALAPIFGAAITWGSHYILASAKRKAEAVSGVTTEGD